MIDRYEAGKVKMSMGDSKVMGIPASIMFIIKFNFAISLIFFIVKPLDIIE